MSDIYCMIDSPVGELLLGGDGQALSRLWFMGQGVRAPQALDPGWRRDDRAYDGVREQLTEYFAGQRQCFEVPLALHGTAWEQRVWQALLAIPYGETRSYGEIASSVSAPAAARAVGMANAHNPVAVIVPCHRVIGASGRLTGFGGGLQRKRALLDLESGRLALTG